LGTAALSIVNDGGSSNFTQPLGSARGATGGDGHGLNNSVLKQAYLFPDIVAGRNQKNL
jgi:hypothetical protein